MGSHLLMLFAMHGTLQNLIFTDEKLFTVQQAHNHQNDRVLAKTLDSIPANTGKVFRIQKPTSVMVWAAISERGESPLVFVPQGVKINKELYIKDILEGALMPWCKSLYGDDNWTLQQEGATSHTAHATQAWYENKCPTLISKEEWPPSSPDLNPLDFSLWSILESEACSNPSPSIEALKSKLIKTWEKIPMETVRASINDFSRRLCAVVKAKGKHFE